MDSVGSQSGGGLDFSRSERMRDGRVEITLTFAVDLHDDGDVDELGLLLRELASNLKKRSSMARTSSVVGDVSLPSSRSSFGTAGGMGVFAPNLVGALSQPAAEADPAADPAPEAKYLAQKPGQAAGDAGGPKLDERRARHPGMTITSTKPATRTPTPRAKQANTAPQPVEPRSEMIGGDRFMPSGFGYTASYTAGGALMGGLAGLSAGQLAALAADASGSPVIRTITLAGAGIGALAGFSWGADPSITEMGIGEAKLKRGG